MEGTDQEAQIENPDIPKVPIKTYKWEDVRRSRRRGRYPWTHLTKPPFDEEVDPEEYTMDAFRRSRSSSTLGKSDTQEISEIEEFELKEETEKPIQEQNGFPENKENVNTGNVEVPSTSKEKTKAPVLSQPSDDQASRAKSEEPKKKRKLSLESSYSRMSLSRLGLKDKFKGVKNKLKVPKLPKRSKSDASELKPKKQKIASTKTTTEEKSKDPWMPPPPNQSPVYIHIPLKPPPGETDEFSQLEFDSPGPSSHSGSLTQLQRIGSGRRKMSLLGILTQIKKVHDEQQQKLASESHKSGESTENVAQTSGKTKRKVDHKQASKESLKMEVDHDEDKEPQVELVESIDSAKSVSKKLDIKSLLGKPRVQRKESDRLVIEDITDDDKRSNKSLEVSTKSETEISQKPRTPEPIVDEPEDSSADDNISQYLDKEDKCEIVSEKSANVSSENVSQAGPSKVEQTPKQIKPEPEIKKSTPDPEKTRKLQATLSMWKKQLAPSSPAVTTAKVAVEQTQRQRAKSEEPKRKRRSSIESSYSRKSLSKLAFMKRLKEAKDKIKLPKFPSFGKSDSKKSKEKKADEETVAKPEEKQKKSKLETKQPEKPVYIHIPLKLAPGQTDEFSHLAEETSEKIPETEKPKVEVKQAPESESSVPTSPDVPGDDIQMIFLTPPSDDEILDTGLPETPSETDQKFFENLKIDDLKHLAKRAVDTICPDAKKLETVTEDEDSDEHSGPESSQEPTTLLEKDKDLKEEKMEEDLQDEKKGLSQKQQQILVDEEDGLKLSDAAIAMINDELAKETKEQEQGLKSSLKKKVSFKRKSRAEDGERIYEDVELSNDPTKANIADPQPKLESFQSMSVDEEKSYLDKKVVKDTSLEDDYNKWSKLNDHEYEPVNPPPEEITSRGPPVVQITDTNLQQPPTPTEKTFGSSTTSPEHHFVRIPPDEELIVHGETEMPSLDENVSAQEVQRRIEDRYFNATPETTSSRTDGELNTSQVDSSALETLPLKKESRKKTTATTKDEKETPGKSFNETLRTQAGKIKTKLQGIKRPNITLPQRPKFPTTKLKKPNFKKPNFTMPKMPERPSIHLPSFSLTRKDSAKDSWRNRQLSTESNAGDSTKKIFDFRTYPRIFDKYKKKKGKESSPSKDERDPTPPPPEFATVPRVNRKKGPIGSRWVNKFKDIKYADDDPRKSKEIDDEETQDVIRIPLHPDNEDPMDVPSHTRYNEDIDIDDDFDRENRDIHRTSPFSRDYLKRWNQGEFHEDPMAHQPQYGQEINRDSYRVTDLDNDVEETQTPPGDSFEIGIPQKEEHSSGSISEHRRGVLEEIDSDEFFLREKGISQDNIEVGKYLSSEIREAFRNPVNALSQLQGEDREYDLDVSDQSESLQDTPRRKPLRKPKRKKTPNVSKEKVSYDRESITTEPEEYPKPFDEFIPPARPKRKSKKGKKKKPTIDDVIPYQETIPIEEQLRSFTPTDERLDMLERSPIAPGNILGDDQQRFYDRGSPPMYENEHMKGIDQPDIKISDPYYKYENFQRDIDKFLGEEVTEGAPIAPTRKHRSLKSLNASEPDSIADEIKFSKEIPQQEVEAFRAQQEYIIPTPEPPSRPKRMRSRTESQSGASQQEDDRTSRGADSLISDTQAEVVEEPCIQDIRDSMGYAIIDKSKVRDPPLPPLRIPSTPPRVRRSKKNAIKEDTKFSTVPRSVTEGTPVRPLRNYSTLGGSRGTSRSKSPTSLHSEEKENIDLGQYIEIEHGEPVRRLQTGEIIQKMRDRPLPAPPRPPRRPRGSFREVFRDISHERNIPTESQTDLDKTNLEEAEMSTQTEPDGFITEARIPPDHSLRPTSDVVLSNIEQEILQYDNQETVTHGALLVQPIDNAQILPQSQFSNFQQKQPQTQHVPVERIIPVTREYTVGQQPFRREQKTYDDDDEETSEIPEEFTKLKNPSSEKKVPHQQHLKDEIQQQDNQEVGLLKAQKLQVLDLDVDKLRVNELQASKIIVSELDGVSLQVSEINSKSGNLVVSGIELPPHLIQEMLDRLQSAAHEQAQSAVNQSSSPQSSETQTMKPESTITEKPTETLGKDTEIEQKKTSIDQEQLDTNTTEVEVPPVPPRYDSKTDLLDENLEKSKRLEPEPEFEPEPEDEPEPDPPEAFEALLSQESNEQIISSDSITEERTPEEPPVRPPRRSFQIGNQNLEEPTTPELSQNPNIQSISRELLETIRNLEEPDTEELPVYSPMSPNNFIVLSMIPPEFSDSVPPADTTSKSEEELPPRPPQPAMEPDLDYIPSQPPPSFFMLRSPPFGEFIEEDIPLPPRRKRHHKAPKVSGSSSEEVPPTPRRHPRSPEPSIPQLTGQLVRACATETDRSIKRLISHITSNMFHNADGKQDLHVMILMLLILIAGLILLSGDDKVTIHHHHWEFFNPPRDL